MTNTLKRDVREFWLVFLESRQQWYGLLDNLDRIGPFPAVGYAFTKACEVTGRGEVEWECTLDAGDAYHYEADDEFRVHDSNPRGQECVHDIE